MRLEKRVWDDDAERGLNGAFDDVPASTIAQWVDAGTCELWRVNDDSWLVTGVEKDGIGRYLFVWSYAGRNARGAAEALRKIARKNGMRRIQFVTYHKGLPRLVSNIAPRLICVTDRGARLYEASI